MPEWITALHEESAVTMAHGYAKAEGKPMLAVLHGTIGIQHAAMSIYQAYYDRVPMVMIAGNDADFIPAHTAHDMAGMVRSYTKWDAQPETVEEALVAIQRAYNEAITPPMAPTLVVLSSEIQKVNVPNVQIPDLYSRRSSPTIDATHGAGNRESSARGAKSEDRRGTLANSRRREARRGTRRTGGRMHQHGGHARTHEFPAASSAVRAGRGHHLRLHARSGSRRRAGFHQRPGPGESRRTRDTTHIDFGGSCDASNFGRAAPREIGACPSRPMPRPAFRSSSKK